MDSIFIHKKKFTPVFNILKDIIRKETKIDNRIYIIYWIRGSSFYTTVQNDELVPAICRGWKYDEKTLECVHIKKK